MTRQRFEMQRKEKTKKPIPRLVALLFLLVLSVGSVNANAPKQPGSSLFSPSPPPPPPQQPPPQVRSSRSSRCDEKEFPLSSSRARVRALPCRLRNTRGGALVRRGDSWPRKSKPSLATASRVAPAAEREPTQDTKTRRGLARVSRQQAAMGLIGVCLAVTLFHTRAAWQPFLNKESIQQGTLKILAKLAPPETADPQLRMLLLGRSLGLYALGMAVWEAFGLSTIPVETAAGMVFGPIAAVASLTGKMLGASMAFGTGRLLFPEPLATSPFWSQYTLFQALAKSEDANSLPPIATAFLMKFSFFPEAVKNFGSSVLPGLQWNHFLTATLFHGGLFTLLWTALGVDTAARLHDEVLPANRSLQVALTAALLMAVVGTPLLMAWWMRQLQIVQQTNVQPSPSPPSPARNNMPFARARRQTPQLQQQTTRSRITRSLTFFRRRRRTSTTTTK